MSFMTVTGFAIFFHVVTFLAYTGLWASVRKWCGRPALTGLEVACSLAGWTLGAVFIGPFLFPEAKAQEVQQVRMQADPLGDLIRQVELRTYPQWGDKDETFPVECEGSYRTRLNCARLVWDRNHNVKTEGQ